MKIIDRSLVLSVKYEDDPDTYDIRLHRLGHYIDEFVVLNPDVDPRIVECIDLNERSQSLIVWSKDDVWVAKKFHRNWQPRHGWKIYTLTFGILEQNPNLPEIFLPPEFDIQLQNYVAERHYEHIWYLNQSSMKSREKIWVYRYRAHHRIIGTKDMGFISPNLPEKLDVFFLCYDEPNAVMNYDRLLTLCPRAKKISGIKGILNAHKELAAQSETDMFYVIDADAWVLEDFNFDFQPDIFDRDCTHIWLSYNNLTKNVYGNGGIKLLNKKSILAYHHHNQLDYSTNFTSKIKIIDKIGSQHNFASDDYHAWKGAFRETIKLLNSKHDVESKIRLSYWKNIEVTDNNSKFAKLGVDDAERYFNGSNDLGKINDIDWLKKYFQDNYGQE